MIVRSIHGSSTTSSPITPSALGTKASVGSLIVVTAWNKLTAMPNAMAVIRKGDASATA